MIDVLCVFGTRPELNKIVGVVEALRRRGLAVQPLATGQHTSLLDAAMLARIPDVTSLEIESDGSMLRFVTRATKALTTFMQNVPVRCVLVQGDTASGLVASEVARTLGIPVAHVEAGVRSHDVQNPWPEELIRVAIDRNATWLYAPTATAARNLLNEAYAGHPGLVGTPGNTSIDTLRESGVKVRFEASPTLLVTLHRRELRQRPDVLDVLQTLVDAVETSGVNAIWPIHPAMVPLASQLRVPSNFSIRPPMAHKTMLHVLAESRGLLTDSGGLVEEAAALGVPTAILRSANDRPEAVEAGIAIQYAPTPDGAKLAIEALAMERISRRPSACFGDGYAAERIAEHLASVLTQG